MYLILLLIVANASPIKLHAHDFSIEYQSQTLYFNFIDSVSVEISGCSFSSTDSLIIPDTVKYLGESYAVTRIGEQAFNYHTDLTYVSIPGTVVAIGKWAFHDCNNLQYTEYLGSLEQWCNIELAYGGDPGTWYPGTSPIQYSRNLIINGEEIMELVIPEGVTKIKPFTFEYCNSIVSVVIPSTVDTIDLRAFAYCENIASVTLPNSLHFLGMMAFEGCHGLESFVVPDSVSKIDYATFRDCNSLTSVAISDNVTFLESQSFLGCSSLASISIPRAVSRIAPSTFEECRSLTTIVIPDSVRLIGTKAFYRCSRLSSIVIGASVDSIGDYAFGGITNPDTIQMKSPTPPTITFYTFHEMPTNATIKVPCGAQQQYNNAYYWNVFTNIIEDCNEGIMDAADMPQHSIRSENGMIIIPDEIAEGVKVYSIEGRQIAFTFNHNITVLTKGVYFVKIGNGPAQKVLVQ